MALSIKPGVGLLGLRPEVLAGLQAAEGVYTARGWTLRLTSATDGKHKRASLHYAGQAVDLGLPPSSPDFQAQLAELVLSLRIVLGDEFDVVPEADHVHLEWQPKGV